MKTKKPKRPKMISMKLPEHIIADLKALSEKGFLTVSAIIEMIVMHGSGRCPACGKRWPKDSEPKISFTTRVNPKITESIDSKDIPSRYYSAAIHKYLGYCPLCSQKVGVVPNEKP